MNKILEIGAVGTELSGAAIVVEQQHKFRDFYGPLEKTFSSTYFESAFRYILNQASKSIFVLFLDRGRFLRGNRPFTHRHESKGRTCHPGRSFQAACRRIYRR